VKRSFPIYLPILLLVAGARVVAQTPEETAPLEHVDFRLGVYGGFARNFHETEATIFSSGGDCGAFSDGAGNGFAAGVFGEFPLLDQWFDLTAGLTFARRGGAFGEAYTAGLPVLDPNTNQYVPLERRHNYTANLDFLLVDFGVRVTPVPEIPFYLKVGGSAGFPITQATYRQTEEILSPSGVLYPETNTVEREVGNGPIRDVQTLVTAAGALGYTLPIGPRLSIAPEVSYYYPFTDITLANRWRISTAQIGVALRYDFGRSATQEEPEPEPQPMQPIAAETPEAPVTTSLATVSSPSLEIVRTIVTETFPILPYIFFDSADATIPDRYGRVSAHSRDAFDENGLPHRSLDAYYGILNVIGKRMADNGDATLTLNGTTDGREETIPGAANNLARARAQAVKDYLVTVWDIDPARLSVVTSTRPTFPSSTEYVEGVQENRRVEISSPNDDILRPIIHEKFNEYSYQPRKVEFATETKSPADIQAWKMTIRANGTPVMQRSGTGTPPKTVGWTIDDTTAGTIAGAIAAVDHLDCTLEVTDARGKEARSDYRIPAGQSTHPFEVSRLSLIVFDFDKSTITPQNKRMISSFVSESILPTSKATIVGSTDRLGELEHNQELSQARAVAVQDLIAAQRPDAQITETKGIGPSRLLYDNSVPEGRYYCRTVTVEVETPIEGIKAQ